MNTLHILPNDILIYLSKYLECSDFMNLTILINKTYLLKHIVADVKKIENQIKEANIMYQLQRCQKCESLYYDEDQTHHCLFCEESYCRECMIVKKACNIERLLYAKRTRACEKCLLDPQNYCPDQPDKIKSYPCHRDSHIHDKH